MDLPAIPLLKEDDEDINRITTDKMARIIRIIAGIVLTAFGVLWTLQGADVIWVKPILCFADCETLVGGSSTWLVVGSVSILIGVFLLAPRSRPRA